MALEKKQASHARRLTPARAALFGSSIVLSAMLSAAALRTPGLHWLAWVSLLPLFQAIRTLRLPLAALAGGLWGGCLYGLAAYGATPAIAPTALSLILLTAAPATYCGLGALLTRWIGFNPFVLAVGWIGVELALTPLGLPLGIMAAATAQGDLAGAGAQGGSVFLQWTGHLLGYAFIAFLVACFNASLIAMLSCTRWLRPARALLSGWLPTEAFALPQSAFALPRFTLRESFPRAPPRR